MGEDPPGQGSIATLCRMQGLAPNLSDRWSKGYDTRAWVAAVRTLGITPHVAQHTKRRRSAIDGRATRHDDSRHS